MSKYIILQEKESVHGCCNMVVWDFIISWLFVGLVASEYLHLHTAFCILFGLVASILFIFIMNIKYIGPILQIGISVFWTTQVWDIFKDFEWFQHNIIEDTIWNWTVKIGLTLLFIGLHLLSFHDLRDGDDTFDIPFFSKNKNYTSETTYINDLSNELTNIAQNLVTSYEEVFEDVNSLQSKMKQKKLKASEKDLNTINQIIDQFNQKCSDFRANFKILSENVNEATISSIFERCNELLIDLKILRNQLVNQYTHLEQQQNYENTSNRSNQADKQSSTFDPTLFAGCNSKESLTKRYKNLMKTFHPDNADGDTEMTQKIKETYKRLLEKYT